MKQDKTVTKPSNLRLFIDSAVKLTLIVRTGKGLLEIVSVYEHPDSWSPREGQKLTDAEVKGLMSDPTITTDFEVLAVLRGPEQAFIQMLRCIDRASDNCGVTRSAFLDIVGRCVTNAILKQ
jgi:hypothetical protein